MESTGSPKASGSDKDSSNDTSFCPVCDKSVSNAQIVSHVDKCLFLRQSELEKESDGKRSFSIFGKSPKVAAKKVKLNNGNSSPVGTSLSKKQDKNLIDLTDEPVNEDVKGITKKVSSTNSMPLAEQVRPKSIDEFIG